MHSASSIQKKCLHSLIFERVVNENNVVLLRIQQNNILLLMKNLIFPVFENVCRNIVGISEPRINFFKSRLLKVVGTK